MVTGAAGAIGKGICRGLLRSNCRVSATDISEKGLEEYYRSRNLLKAQITADHVANAVLFCFTSNTNNRSNNSC